MEKYNTNREQHAYRIIQRDIKDGKLSNLIFFYGEEQYLIKWAIGEIVENCIPKAVEQLNFSVINWEVSSIADLIDQCETLPMFSDRRIVVLENFNTAEEKAAGKNEGKDDKAESLIRYLKEFPESCILIMTSTDVDKRKKAYKTINKLGKCYDFSRLNEMDFKKFVWGRFNREGKIVDNQIINKIIEITGYFDKKSNYNLYNLDNDMKKIIAHSTNKEISINDLLAGLSQNTESYVFDMIDAISNSKNGEALTILHSLMQSGEAWQKLLALICSGYELMLVVKEMKDDGFRANEIKEKTKAHEYRIKIASRLCEQYSTKRLCKIICSCFEADKNIKSGLLEDRLAMELLIAGINEGEL
jgi:DNA polymerase-3 subunit delta